MNTDQKIRLTEGLYDLLHCDKKAEFIKMASVLLEEKLAKWPLLTVIPYYDTSNEVFIAPPRTPVSLDVR